MRHSLLPDLVKPAAHKAGANAPPLPLPVAWLHLSPYAIEYARAAAAAHGSPACFAVGDALDRCHYACQA